jgi:hypothetical protein
MRRLVEVDDAHALSHATLQVRVGEALLFRATGIRLEDPVSAPAELLGPFVSSVPGPDGAVLTPAALPNAVLLLARSPGRCNLEVIVGEGFADLRSTPLVLDIIP